MVVEEKFYIGYSDINRDKMLSNTAMLKIFEDMATMHGSLAGESIKTSPIRWFLTSYHIKVHRRPTIEDKITARTWSREIRGVSACREFEIVGQNGEVLVTALSNWARINSVTARLERAAPEVLAAYGSEKERTNFPYVWAAKLNEGKNILAERDFTVERNFIDINDHMNNIHYLELAYLTLPEKVYSAGESDEFKIYYRQASRLGEKLKCAYSADDVAHTVTVKGEDGTLRAVIALKQ